jgi:hypothetical protein
MKSCTDQRYAALILKLRFIEASIVSTPSHSVLSSSTKGCIRTFNFLPGCFGPGTTRARNIYSGLKSVPGGRFNGVTKTGQHEYGAASLPNGVKPSVATASRTFLLSLAKSGMS